MTDISNLTGLEKPLTKLIETVGDGLGVAGNALFKFDAKKIKRTSEAEAEAEKARIIKKAEGEAEALEVLGRASQRFALEQFNRQINLENIVVKSQNLLNSVDVSDVPVTKDWSARFIGVAQEISDDEMQDILANILAGEVKAPNTYSLRTLELVRNLEQKDLKQFQKFTALSTKTTGLFVTSPGSNEELERYGLSFGGFIHLADTGLFNPSTSLRITITLEPKQTSLLQLGGRVLSLTPTGERKTKLVLPLLKFTEMGTQIAGVLPQAKVDGKYIETYTEALTRDISSRGIAVNQLIDQ